MLPDITDCSTNCDAGTDRQAGSGDGCSVIVTLRCSAVFTESDLDDVVLLCAGRQHLGYSILQQSQRGRQSIMLLLGTSHYRSSLGLRGRKHPAGFRTNGCNRRFTLGRSLGANHHGLPLGVGEHRGSLLQQFPSLFA
jgi:hypothetical protein